MGVGRGNCRTEALGSFPCITNMFRSWKAFMLVEVLVALSTTLRNRATIERCFTSSADFLSIYAFIVELDNIPQGSIECRNIIGFRFSTFTKPMSQNMLGEPDRCFGHIWHCGTSLHLQLSFGMVEVESNTNKYAGSLLAIKAKK